MSDYNYDRRESATGLSKTEEAVLLKALTNKGSIEIILERGGGGVRAHQAAQQLTKKGLLSFVDATKGMIPSGPKSQHWTSTLYRLTPAGAEKAQQIAKAP